MSGFENFAVVAPLLALVLGAVVPAVLKPAPAVRARLAYGGAISALAAVLLAIAGHLASDPWAPGDSTGDLFRMDGLSALMLGTVGIIGVVVARFGIRYLDRDVAQPRFSFWLSYTLAAILTIPIANHLLLLMLAWLVSSHGLHHLLTLYPERPGALLAARKKFIISRLGDAFLIVAFSLIYLAWGTFDLGVLFDRAAAGVASGETGLVSSISLLIVLGALTKSAQLPFHTWLPDTMETPAPVSALMHAGIVNAGGFLVIRLSPLLARAPEALGFLAFVGAGSAMAGSLMMLTQNDVKRKLAYSTISQMGFMMLQCGLGAFSAAMLHLVGHSFYKAHAFLTAGSWVDSKASAKREAPDHDSVAVWKVALATLVGIGLTGLAITLAGVDLRAKPGGLVLASVLAIALAQALVIWSLVQGHRLFRPKNAAIALGTGLGVALFYLGSVGQVDRMLGESIARPILGHADPASLGGTLLVGLFAVAMLMQTFRARLAASDYGPRVYALLRNGFYLGDVQDRWIRRFWSPKRLNASETSH